MDRTIHDFQDRTEYGSYDPMFPGYEEVEKMRCPTFPGLEKLETSVFQYFQDMRNQTNPFSNISRILENVADSNFQHFQAGTN